MTVLTLCIVAGHRGFKGEYCENTILGFQKCFETGATMFETDVWTTKDGVLVISHDVNTKRVFCDKDGNETNFNILETNYDDLKELRTIGSGEKLLSFKDLLTWFVGYIKESGSSDHRIMLDIKRLNPPKLLQLLVKDMLDVHSDLRWWIPRVQLGLWDLRFIKYLNQDQYFQDVFGEIDPIEGFRHFDVLHISGSWEDSLRYMAYNEYVDSLRDDRFKFKITGISLIYVTTWSSGFLTKFLPVLKKQDLKLYTWTINNFVQLDYFVNVGRAAHIREYGVISDFPDKMVEHLEKEDTESTVLVASEIAIPFKMRLASWCFSTYLKFATLRGQVPVEFEGEVDPNERVSVGINKFSLYFFATLQKYGIF